MVVEERGVLDFHIAKLKIIFLSIILLPFAILGIGIIVYGIMKIDIIFSLFGVLIAFPFVIPVYLVTKRLANPEPYLTLTHEGLIINAHSEHAILILWDDIIGYHIKRINSVRFIAVLFDQNKYLASMSPESKKLYNVDDSTEYYLDSFVVAFSNIKRKDREKLISELDRLAGTYPSLTDQVYHPEKLSGKKQKAYDRINKKYFLKSYGYSLIFAVIALFFFFVTNGDRGYFILIILQFILFPFSKLLYDVLVGFKINDFLDKQDHMAIIYLDRLLILVYLFIYLFTFILGPLGILYLVIVSSYRFIKRKWF